MNFVVDSDDAIFANQDRQPYLFHLGNYLGNYRTICMKGLGHSTQ